MLSTSEKYGIKAEYEDDHALFMLHSMFNQFKDIEVQDVFNANHKDFFLSMTELQSRQKESKTKPTFGELPHQVQNIGRSQDDHPVKNETLHFKSPTSAFNYKSVVKWKVFNLKNEQHLRILKDQVDPVSLEPLLEIGLSGQDEVIQLPCATKRMRCNFLKQSVVQCFQQQPQCPVCKTFYMLPGKQPSGRMRISVDFRRDCEGYIGDGVITMSFSFPNGVQGPNHQSPGKKYTGGSRIGYLPCTMDGKKALALLKDAFLRGELFSIGKSLTTGAQNILTYGTIHLKTALHGGTSTHGWPDETYFQRLRDECAAKMIFDQDVKKEMDKAKAKSEFIEII